MPKKSIFIDARTLKIQPNRGTSKHLQSFIRNAKKFFSGRVIVYSGLRNNYNSAFGRLFYIFEEQFVIPLLLLIKRRTFIVSPMHTAPLVTFASQRILILHDLMFLDNVGMYGIRGKMFLSSIYRALCIKSALWLNRGKVITVSNTSKDDISQRFSIARDSIFLLPNSYEFSDFNRESAVKRSNGYFLCVTGKADHKNFNLVKSVFSKNLLPNFKLKVVGDFSTDTNTDTIKYYTNISDDKLKMLYINAAALIFPSLKEGFGIPLLEAINFKLPIICSNIPTFREIMGDKALYFDPNSEDELYSNLLLFSKDNSTDISYEDIRSRFEERSVQEQSYLFFRKELG